MPVAPSFTDLLDLGKSEAQSRRPDLVFADGDVSEAMLHAAAAMADLVLSYLSQAFKETFLDGAEGEALTDLVDDHLGLQRQDSAPALVTVTFSRPSAAGGAGTIVAGTRVATGPTADGAQVVFATDANAVFGGADLSVSVTATAELVGASGNVDAGTVTKLLSEVFDSTITVNNPAGAAGGMEEEADSALRDRARTFWQVLARGTLSALVYGAKLVPGVAVATPVESLGTGLVKVRVADASGNGNLALAAQVAAELENWRAAGVAVEVESVSKQLVDLNLRLRVKQGFSVASVASLISASVTSRINELDVGETLYLDTVIAATIMVAPSQILDVAFVGLGSDIVPAATVVLRAGTITVAEL